MLRASPRRGEIYWVDWTPGRGSEQTGVRPAVVVQNNAGNRSAPTTIVATMTRTITPRAYSFLVVLEPNESGLDQRGTVNCAQIMTVYKSRLGSPIGYVVTEAMKRIDLALKASLELT